MVEHSTEVDPKSCHNLTYGLFIAVENPDPGHQDVCKYEENIKRGVV